MQIKRILVPVDFSDRSVSALRYTIDLARDVGAQVDVVHVWEPPAYVGPDMMVSLAEEEGHRSISELARSEISKEMQRLLDELEQEGGVKLCGKLEIGSVPKTILGLVNSGDYDLLVVATHGRTGLSRLVLGSVAEQLVRSANCPVLTLHGPHAER